MGPDKNSLLVKPYSNLVLKSNFALRLIQSEN